MMDFDEQYQETRTRKMVFFNGSVKVKICEAIDLRPTDFSTRHQMMGSRSVQMIDPYIAIDIDETHVNRTTAKPKTNQPTWNEEFTTEVHNGQNISLTVFHSTAIPPDEFVANCSVAFEDLKVKTPSDIWVRIIFYFNIYFP